MNLHPCPSCRRHVAINERACPFCACVLDAGRAPVDPIGRLSRAAVFVAGAVTLGGCWTTKAPDNPTHTTQTEPRDAGVSTPDAKTVVKQRINDEDDEDNRDVRHRVQNHPCSPGGPGQPPVCAPYGAPPARRRVV